MILQEEKVLPSFVFMKDEGEVWQVTHENQANVCWKCGQRGHVGARCNQPTLTFDALDADQSDKEGAGSGTGGGTRSWAHVVKTGGGQLRPVSASPASKVLNELEKQEAIMKKVSDERKTAEADMVSNSAENVEAGAAADIQATQADDAALAEAAALAELDRKKLADADLDMKKVAGNEKVDSSLNEQVKSISGKQKSKKQKVDQSDQYVDVEMASGFEVSDSDEVDPAVIGIQPLGAGSFDATNAEQSLDSQATSKAGLSFDSMAIIGSGLSAASGDQESGNLKVIIPDSNKSDSSAEGSPLHHKKSVQNQEVMTDLPSNQRSLDNRGFKSFLAAKHLDGGNSSDQA